MIHAVFIFGVAAVISAHAFIGLVKVCKFFYFVFGNAVQGNIVFIFFIDFVGEDFALRNHQVVDLNAVFRIPFL